MSDTPGTNRARTLPLALLQRYRPLIDDWAGFIDTMRRPLPACVWTNPLRARPEQLEPLLAADGLEPTPIGWDPSGFRLRESDRFGTRWWYLAGLCHAQEEVSRVPVALLEPQPGERILDLCAAPGGKTAQIGIALLNRGTVVANDLTIDRMRPLRANLERLGLINISVTAHDGTAYPNAAGRFDRVLVDAPCSGEGTLRKRSTRHTPSGPEISRRFAERQAALLKRAVALCRPGGRIVYSTCTFAPEENERVVDR
ncbi:MAG: RsmB/NOP family class I SAM-dependent RNA methyltransferase, partial [Chromatiales bacterium]